jgi:proline dehydrogenase
MNPISSIILKMSESKAWERRIGGWRVTRRVVRRFMPGEQLEDGIDAVRRLNERGFSASLNPVGEHVHSEAEAGAAADEYITILRRVRDEGLDSNLSVKLSLLGLDLGAEVAVANLTRVLEAAAEQNTFVRIDMEGSGYVDPTLQIHERLRGRFPELGVVIQSYLQRSAADVEALAAKGAAIRLVKGAYKEPPEIAFADKADVDRNFAELMERLLRDDARAAGVRLAVATHDPALVERGIELARLRGIDSNLEFQMLYGIARGLQDKTLAAGYPVRIYVSYGPAWYPWFMRRLAERPANLGFFLKHLFG